MLRSIIWGGVANTSVYGAILSLAFVADELVAFIANWRESGGERGQSLKNFFGFMVVYSLLLALAVACMLPPSDGNFSEGWRFHHNFVELFYLFCRSLTFLVPIPLAKPDFWNTLVLTDFTGFIRWMVIPSAVVILVAVWLTLRVSPRYLRLFMLGFVGIWIFTVVKYYGFARHMGAETILLLACLWLAAGEEETRYGASSWSSRAIGVILGTQVVAWGIASWYHLNFDFSGSREMAQFIRVLDAKLPPIVADADDATSSVAGYLNQPLYYASNRKVQTYIRWNRERTGGGVEDTLAFAHELAEGGNRVLLLLNYPLESQTAKFLARTRGAIVADEVFYLYEYVH